MPVSVFKEGGVTRQSIVVSEVSGVQLYRQLALATRADLRPTPAHSLVRELLEAEFQRLSHSGVFSFGQIGRQPREAGA
jgi:LysR family nitrogen assimilation transcriptional regulator